MFFYLIPLLITALLILPVAYRIRRKGNTGKVKTAFILNLCSFFAVLLMATFLPLGEWFTGETVAAEETVQTEEAADAAAAAGLSVGMGYLSAALAVGLGSIGCGIALANAAPAAIGAVSEEPSSFGKALIFVALGEGVALYGFLIAFMIINKL